MFGPRQMIEGVEGLWLVWMLAVAVVLRMLWLALRRWRRPNWGRLAAGEDGVSYSLSYVLVMPVFLLFVCIVFEVTWLLLAKIGTLYAAHAGARSAIVWSSAKPESLRTARINQAVWTAMTPFATGDPSGGSLSGDAYWQAQQFSWAYGSFVRAGGDPYANSPANTIVKRYYSAASRTTWNPPVEQLLWENNVTFTVTYRAPLHIPGVARLFDPDGAPPYEYPISSTATLPNEAPVSSDRTLGIDYWSANR